MLVDFEFFLIIIGDETDGVRSLLGIFEQSHLFEQPPLRRFDGLANLFARGINDPQKRQFQQQHLGPADEVASERDFRDLSDKENSDQDQQNRPHPNRHRPRGKILVSGMRIQIHRPVRHRGDSPVRDPQRDKDRHHDEQTGDHGVPEFCGQSRRGRFGLRNLIHLHFRAP